MKQKALIYCRVSSERQKNEGSGLESQEQRCRVFASQKELEVVKVFRDSFTGGGDFMKRPAMRELLDFIDSKPHENFVVIFDDLKRFARDVVKHWELRAVFEKLGVELMSPNFEFKQDSEEGWLHETISATFNEYDRRTNRRQVIQKQKARLENGYWAFGSIMGYEQKRHPEHGNLLTPIEPEASHIKEVLEGFADGRFNSKQEMADFLVSKGFRNRKRVHFGTIDRLFNIIYAGFIEYKPWDVKVRKGHHQALISLDTWQINQAKLQGKKIVHTRKDTNEDFPLRNLALCADCLKPLTASWTTGRNDKYPYYRCNQKDCVRGSKSVDREYVHSSFEKRLEEVKPSPEILELTKAIVLDVWQKKQKDIESEVNTINKDIEAIQVKIDGLMARIVRTDDDALISIYEGKIKELSSERLNLLTRKKGISGNEKDFGTVFSDIVGKVKNPLNTWVHGGLQDKKSIFNLVYSGPIVFDWETGFGTAQMSPIFELFETISASDSEYVEHCRGC